MNLAILHYHLNRGGVMQVIVNHLRALDAVLDDRDRWRVALVYGGRREGWPDALPQQCRALEVQLCEVPGLDYDQAGSCADPESLGRAIGAGLEGIGFTPESTVIHAHNHALGKNVSLPGALTLLAGEGYALLLQIHDFAEDFRPANYARLHSALAQGAPGSLGDVLYPEDQHVHYAVLNRRDAAILQQAGFRSERVHLLPNPVSDPGPLPCRDRARAKLAERFGVPQERRWLLYPVRGIARKNVGEMLLWSALLAGRAWVGLTLPPINPLERPGYDDWKALARELDLPCVFEVGATAGLSFAENLAAADLILSTSVAEGFGMAFLECWLAGRYLVGRDLPEITSDFVEAGVQLAGLRSRLAVPVEWIGRDAFYRAMADAYRKVVQTYERPVPGDTELQEAVTALIQDGLIDFGTLSAELQRQIISEVRLGPERRQQLLELNGWIDAALATDAATATAAIQHNAAVIGQAYAPEACGRRLVEMYQSVVHSPHGDGDQPVMQRERILDAFLDLSRFRPLRC